MTSLPNHCSLLSFLLVLVVITTFTPTRCHAYSITQPGRRSSNTFYSQRSSSATIPLFFTDYENNGNSVINADIQTNTQGELTSLSTLAQLESSSNSNNNNFFFSKSYKSPSPTTSNTKAISTATISTPSLPPPFFADEIDKLGNILPNKYNTRPSSSSTSKSLFTKRLSFLPNNQKQSSPLFFADELIDQTQATKVTISTIMNKKNDKKNNMISPTSLTKYQTNSKPILSSFTPKAYNPHPLLTNEHLQTILGVFIRDDPGCAYINPNATNVFQEVFPIVKAIGKRLPTMLGLNGNDNDDATDKDNNDNNANIGIDNCNYWDERECINTPDGDFFDVDYKYVNTNHHQSLDKEIKESEGMVIIVHGLESNSNSSVCINMAKSFISNNFDVVCMNYRGCSGRPNDTVYQYHGGFTTDLKQLIGILSERRNKNNDDSVKPPKPLYMSGFSLGSNIVMKCLGELSLDAVTKHNIRGAAVTAAPFHLRPHHRRLIDEPVQRIVYAGSILKSMKKKADYIIEKYCNGNTDTKKFNYWMVKNASTIAEVEDGMIAPLYGFKDKFDYFDRSASLNVVDDIAVPTLVLNAADDPFFSTTWFPWHKDSERGGKAPLKLVKTEEGGGHLGHLFHMFDDDDKEKYRHEYPVASFALSELGRFISHVHTEIKTDILKK